MLGRMCPRQSILRGLVGPSGRRAAGLAWLLVLGGLAGADRAAEKPAPSASEQVAAELRAANAARTRLLKEQQAWRLEKEKLRLLESAVRGEAERFETIAAKARQAEAELRKQAARRRAGRERLQLVEAMVDALCERLEKALGKLASGSLPGLVPPDRAAGITDPAQRLAAGAQRIDDAERRAKSASVEIVQGTLAGRSTTVKLLRAGGVAGWWITLDARRAGTAAVTDGKLKLLPAAGAGDVEAIKKAFAIVEGRGTPDWVLLPLGRVRRREPTATSRP